MEKPVKTINKYDSACPEEEANLQSLRTSLIDQETSSEMANWFKTFSDPTRIRTFHKSYFKYKQDTQAAG